MATESRHLSIVIDRPPSAVYDYASDPANLSLWAAGLASTPGAQVDGRWEADSPMGRITIAFAEPNALGVLDHVVTLPSGERVYNPLRVIPHGDDSEVVFTLRRRPGMTDDELEQDAEAVRADLEALKQVLESGRPRPARLPHLSATGDRDRRNQGSGEDESGPRGIET